MVLTIANFMISVILIPFLLVMQDIYLYAVVVVLGLVFGFIFNFLITDIEHLETRHHVFAGTFIPLIGIIDIFIMITISNDIARVFKLMTHSNALYVAIVYVVSFMLPYIITNFTYLVHKEEQKTMQ